MGELRRLALGCEVGGHWGKWEAGGGGQRAGFEGRLSWSPPQERPWTATRGHIAAPWGASGPESGPREARLPEAQKKYWDVTRWK